MKQLTIEPATKDKVKEIVALDRLCFDGIWSEEGYLREIDSPNSSLLLLWLQEDRSAPQIIGIGCLWSIVKEAHITLLGVHPHYQKQGLGMLLLYSLLKDATERNLERATLEVKTTNQIAINLYQKFGFRVVGKRKNYYPKTGEDALILWLDGLNKAEFSELLAEWQRQIKNRLDRQYQSEKLSIL